MSEYVITILVYTGIYAIAVLGLNITWGFAGQVNLGQAAFVGIGAMTSAILTMRLGIPFWLALIASGFSALVIGLLLGMISIRLKHDFLAITTIGFNFIITGIFQYYDIFGGTIGIIGVPPPELFGYKLRSISYLALVYAILVIVITITLWIKKTWIGRAFEALSEDEVAAQSLGIDARKYKILAFAIGTMFAGISGSLLAHFKTSITYEDFIFPKSIEILSMSVLGGMDSIPGAFLGSFIVKLLPEIIRPLMELRLAFYSLIILVVLIFMPEGILGRRSILSRQLSKLMKKHIGREI
ncbi:MAG: branched-chain amino acid ABC transporter permease [Desulfurococcaceae archaeon]